MVWQDIGSSQHKHSKNGTLSALDAVLLDFGAENRNAGASFQS